MTRFKFSKKLVNKFKKMINNYLAITNLSLARINNKKIKDAKS
jgi:hypothetical protein